MSERAVEAGDGEGEQKPALAVEGLVAGYARGPAVVREFSLAVQAGEIVAVVGRNGAGKTTLLRAISGLLPPRAGEVRLGREPLHGLSAQRIARRGVAHVPEGRRVIPSMSVVDNLRLGGYPLRGRAALRSALTEVHEMLPALREWTNRRAGTLSGGEQQMLAIGRALMSRPSALLLDEPLTGLAPVFQDLVLDELKKIRQAGVAILLVEQNVQKSLTVADRGVVLDEGALVLADEANRLLEHHRLSDGYMGLRRTEASPPAGSGRLNDPPTYK
jgi:branched-chain amino acid transport system ATP-binding protein